MIETRCKKFDECIQPHICGPSTACIWGQEAADSVGISKQYGKFNTEPKEYSKEVIDAVTSQEITNYEKAIWNAAIDKCIEVANKYDSYGPAYEMRMLKK